MILGRPLKSCNNESDSFIFSASACFYISLSSIWPENVVKRGTLHSGTIYGALSFGILRVPHLRYPALYSTSKSPHLIGLNSEFMVKTFQAAQLTYERVLTIDHSCKIFILYLPNWTSTNLFCVVIYITHCTTHQRSVWQISKKYFARVIYGQKSLMC